jgi:hypothetical protein
MAARPSRPGERPEAIFLIGPQGAGKSTFYRERLFDTHLRISLDLVRTRRREWGLIEACLALKQRFAIDNTNPTRADRERYLRPIRASGFALRGYYFRIPLGECLARNARRAGAARVPPGGLVGTFKKIEVPDLDEGFDALSCVSADPAGGWIVEDLSRAVRQSCEQLLLPRARREADESDGRPEPA